MRGLTGPNTDGYEKITTAGEIEIFRWINFGISSFDAGELEGYNQRLEEENAIRAVFDALTYGWIGQHALISMWSFEKNSSPTTFVFLTKSTSGLDATFLSGKPKHLKFLRELT
jgi:hypothetical protein